MTTLQTLSSAVKVATDAATQATGQANIATLASKATQKAATEVAATAGAVASAAVVAVAINNRIYPGVYDADPVTRPDGSAILNGDVCTVGAGGVMRVRIAGAWADWTAATAAAAQAAADSAMLSEAFAEEWAAGNSGDVDGAGNYSSKEYAQGTQAGTGGSSKNWAQQTGAGVTGAAAGSRSAKSWSQDNLTPTGANLGGSAKDWAIGAGLPDGANKSAKGYAADAAATKAALENRLYPGTFAVAPATRPDGSAIGEGDQYVGTDGYTYARIAGAWVNLTAAAAASANTASAQAGIATTQATAATTAKTAAETARDAANVLGKIYADTATGLANTSGAGAANRYFSVPAAGANELLILYINNGGAAVEVKRYASSAGTFSYQGQVAANSALNALTKPGTYYIPANNGNTDLPAGWLATGSSILIVHDAFDVIAGRFQLQTLREWTNPQNEKCRLLDHNNVNNSPWVWAFPKGSVDVNALANNYDDRGSVIAGTNPDTLTKSGVYLVSGQMTGMPAGSTAGGFLSVELMANQYALQVFTELVAPHRRWVRSYRTDNLTATAWSLVPIAAANLTANFNDRGNLVGGTNPDTVLSAGVYLVSGQMTGMPAGSAATGYLLVAVHNDQYVLQTFTSLLQPNNQWIRYYRKDNATFSAWASLGLGAATVAATNLTDNYNDRGNLVAGTDANTVVKAGTYLVTGAMTNMPAGAPTSGYFDVAVNGGIYITQTFSGLNEPDKLWRRFVRPTNGTSSPWASVKQSPFTGKNVAFIGDSITHIGDYPARVAARIGCNALKMGFAGCRMAVHPTSDFDQMSFYRLADIIAGGSSAALVAAAASQTTATGTDYNTPANVVASTDWSTVDYIVCLFGTNDWAGDVPMGLDASADGTTFKGAINYAVNKILTARPNIKILFASPMWRSRRNAGDGLDADTTPRGDGTYLIDVADAVRSRANANHLPAIDLYREGGFNKYNAGTLLADGLHPAAGVGYQLLADKVAAGLGQKY